MEWFGGSIEQAIKQVRDNESFLCVFVKGLLRPEGGGKHPFSSFHICYRAPGAEEVGSKILQIRLSVPEISRVKV